MIKSFRDKETRKLFEGRKSKALPQDLRRNALKKLSRLDAAEEIGDLRVPPGNRLEALSIDRKGQHSIRVNGQYRVCFVWDSETGDALDVEIADYHQERVMGEWAEKIEREPRIYPPIHPGELLKEEFLDPMGTTVYALAKGIGVDQMRVHKIVRGERAITPDTALRLSRYFGMSDGYWMNAQRRYDLETAKMEAGARILREVTPLARSDA